VALLVLGVVGIGLTTAPPAAAAALPAREITPPIEASNGYRETATTTYSANPARARVDVTVQIDFKNTKPPTPTTTYFYNQVYVFTEHAATHVAVHVDDNPAAVILMDRRQGAFDRRLVRWGTALLFGQTRHITVTYRLPSGAPRSESEIRSARPSPRSASSARATTGVRPGSLSRRPSTSPSRAAPAASSASRPERGPRATGP
jgi:hypothetical protein